MADLKISALNSLAGADLVAADVVAVVDNSASETKKLTVSDLIANGVTLISNSTIPSAKILFSAGSIDTAELAASAVETAKINDSAVTAAKLADNSSVTLVSTLPASGDFIGQIALDTDDNSIVVWNGSAWLSPLASGSVNVVNGSTSGVVNITTSASAGTVTVSATLDDTTAAKQFLAGPTGAGGTVGYRAIASGDLPTATSSAKGAVAVNGNGLTMSNDEIQIDNSVTAETTEHHLVQYDANGLITAGRVIAASDLPEATSSAKGAVVPGSGLSVASGGTLNHTNSATAGTYTKVTVDAQGHVTSAVTLAAADIPDLDAAKITTGTFPTARLADDAVTAAKLADQSVTKFGGAGATDNVVTFPDGDYKGQFFFDEKNEDLYVYTGESFLPITVISGNLVNAGTYDASTNLLSSVTTAGSAAGFTNGAALPAPASGNLNYYVVVDTSGTGSGNAPAVALAPPDMLISLGVAGTTFQLIDVSNAIAGQTAANISVVSTGNIAATDVQAALQELDTEKLAKAGGTMTGNLELGAGIVIVFEGATDDGFETTLTVADATADRTLTLPNESGTLLTTGSSGVVTSAMITDGTIVNADISASAEIAVSKLANGTARQLLQTDVAGTGVEFTSNVDVPGTLDVTGAATFDSTAAVTGALTVTGVINADGKVKFPAGTASAPSFYNGTDTDTGLYFSAANEISVATGGTQRVVVDSSGNVGIAITTPQTKFHSSGTTNGAQATFGISNSGLKISTFQKTDNDAGVTLDAQHSSNGTLRFATTGSERLRIDSSGRMFLGTTSVGAADRFAIHHGSDAANIVAITGADQSTEYLGLGIESGVPTITAGGFTTTSASLVFKTASSGTETERLRIDSSGNVIIGTGSLASNVRLRIKAENSYKSVLQFADQDDDNVGEISYNHDDNTLAFNVNDSERMRIDSSGRLLINNTNASQNHPLQVTAASDSTAIAINGRSADDISALSFYENDRLTLLGEIQYRQDHVNFRHRIGDIRFATGGTTERMRIDSSGRLLVGATSDVSGGLSTTLIQGVATGGGYVGLARNDTSVADGNGIGGLRFYANDPSGYNDVGIVQCVADGTHATDDYPTRLEFHTTADNASSPTERMRIDSSGNVGIGGSPTYMLDVQGTDAALRLKGTANTGFIADQASSGLVSLINYDSGADLRFGTASTERMRIDSSGRLLVGTSSTSGDQSDGDLVVQGASQGELYLSRGSTPANSGGGLGFIHFTGDNGEDSASIRVYSDGGTWTNGSSHPSSMRFETTADGASSPTEAMRIDSSQRVTVKKSSVGEIDALTSASTITPDFAASNNFSVTLGTNATLANPSNLTAGQSGVIAITQDSTGSRTMAFGNKFKFAGGTAPTLTTTASAVDILTYYVESTSRITAQVLLNVS